MRIKSTLISLYVLIFHSIAFAQYNNAKSEAESVLKDLTEAYPGISVAVGVGEEIVWKQGFGLADIENNISATPDHQFRYYSLSKSITGMAIAKLIETKSLNIEKSIRHYLPDLPQHYEDVKIKHLLNHTAGVRHYKNGEWDKICKQDCKSAEEALSVFIDDPLKYTSGEKKSYSSFGYVLLSRLVAKVSGQSYYDFIQSELFAPLGLNIALDQSELLQNEVKYYTKWNAKKKSGKEAEFANNSCKFGGGGLVGTAEDLVKLHLAMINHKIVNETISELYYSEIPTSSGESTIYSFGLASITNDSGYRYNSHSGSARGANGVLMILPKGKKIPEPIVVVILGNIKKDDMNPKSGKIGMLFKDRS